jgi:hypothetical protein
MGGISHGKAPLEERLDHVGPDLVAARVYAGPDPRPARSTESRQACFDHPCNESPPPRVQYGDRVVARDDHRRAVGGKDCSDRPRLSRYEPVGFPQNTRLSFIHFDQVRGVNLPRKRKKRQIERHGLCHSFAIGTHGLRVVADASRQVQRFIRVRAEATTAVRKSDDETGRTGRLIGQ